MSTEIGSIYGRITADVADFLRGMSSAQAAMDEAAASIDAGTTAMDAGLASTNHEADALGRSLVELGAGAAAGMGIATATVEGASAAMDMSLETTERTAAALGRQFLETSGEILAGMTAATVGVVSEALAMSGAIVGAMLAAGQAVAGVVFSLWGLLAVVGVLVAAFAPLAAAMAAVFALGVIGNHILVQWRNGTIHLTGAWGRLAHDLLSTLETISGAVTKPLFHFLLGELHQLDEWVHTAAFRRGMHQVGDDLLLAAHKGVEFVKWVVDEWPTITRLFGDVVDAVKDVAQIVEWLAHEWGTYWPRVRHAAEVAFDWFMKNLWPGLSRAFGDIRQIVMNLAHGFQQAWPQIRQAVSTAWAVVRPMLAAAGAALSLINSALQWMSAHSGPAIAAFANAITMTLGSVQATISAVATGINGIISAVQWLAAHNPLGGNLPAQSPSNNYRSRSVPHGASGGIVTRPTYALIGEAGPEALVPLNRMPGAHPLGGRGGGPLIQIIVNTPYLDRGAAEHLARQLVPHITRVSNQLLVRT